MRRLFCKVTFEWRPEDASPGGEDGGGQLGLVLGLSHDLHGPNTLPRFNDEVKHIKVVEKDSWIHITEAKKFESLLVCDPVAPVAWSMGVRGGPGGPTAARPREEAPCMLLSAGRAHRGPRARWGFCITGGDPRKWVWRAPRDSSGLMTAPALGLLPPKGSPGGQ